MSDARVRAAVIGLGWAGRQHMAAYAELPGVELVALAGMESDQLKDLGDSYGVGLRSRDWRDLVVSGELDVLSVATPTALHAPIAVAALNAGIHVLSEKPMAESAEAARSMVQAARDNDRVLEVAFNHRRRGDVVALKSVVDAGVLGDIYYAKAGWLRRRGIPTLGSWFTRRASAGGGPLMDIGVHMLDMALHLLGEPGVRTATASTYAEFGPRHRGSAPGMDKSGVVQGHFDVEDLATAFLRLDSGATLLLESSWAQWIDADRCYVELSGTEGGARLEWGGSPGSYHSLEVWTEVRGVPAELTPDIGPNGGHTRCVADFLDAVHRGGFDAGSASVALSRAEIVNVCYASADQHREIRVS